MDLTKIIFESLVNLRQEYVQALQREDVSALMAIHALEEVRLRALTEGEARTEQVVWAILKGTLGDLSRVLDGEPDFPTFISVVDKLTTLRGSFTFELAPAAADVPSAPVGLPPDQITLPGGKVLVVPRTPRKKATVVAKAPSKPRVTTGSTRLNTQTGPSYVMRVEDVRIMTEILLTDPLPFVEHARRLWPDEDAEVRLTLKMLTARIYNSTIRSLSLIRQVWDDPGLKELLGPAGAEFYNKLDARYNTYDQVVQATKRRNALGVERGQSGKVPVQPTPVLDENLLFGFSDTQIKFLRNSLLNPDPSINMRVLLERTGLDVEDLPAVMMDSFDAMDDALKLDEAALNTLTREVVRELRTRWPSRDMKDILASLEATTRITVPA